MILLKPESEDDSYLPSYDDAVNPYLLGRERAFAASSPDLYLPQSPNTSRDYVSTSNSSGGNSGAATAGSSSSLPRHFNPVIYTFSQNSFNSMLLSADPQQSPLCYHVSVQMNCFIPSSHTTILRRGDSENGGLVGSFEMGISQKRSTVTIEGTEKLTDVVLLKPSGKSKRTWQWRWHANPRLHISWHCDSPVRYCYLSSQLSSPDATLLASFTPHALTPRADGRTSPPASLKLFPEGQKYADHIVLSALILERRRLTPDADKALRPLFN